METWQLGQIDPLAIPSVVLNRRLQETLAWLNHIQRLEIDPWTKLLQPRPLPLGIDQTVCDVGRIRQRHTPKTENADIDVLKTARLLAYYPHNEETHGTAALASGKFFDYFETPPWDTWAGYFCENCRPFVLCVIPCWETDDAQLGIDASTGKIEWVSSDCSIFQALHSAPDSE